LAVKIQKELARWQRLGRINLGKVSKTLSQKQKPWGERGSNDPNIVSTYE
jgi:hypothetical protein